MSKRVREYLLETIGLLTEAVQSIGKLLEENRLEDSIDILMYCQELAIALGTRIEKLHGTGTPTVSMLEEYCEYIYELGQTIQSAAGDATDEIQMSCDGAYEKLCISMKQVETSFIEEFPNRFEAVLFPYKASMWDSLESIWRAADADPDCDVYVVPIPFYDKNPDGSVKESHYEGDLFPIDVPITPYQEYDIELRLPDVAYIHNPYDEYNYVTSVDAAYYSKNIKKYADKLVYVPYYATAGGMADAQAMCPAYIHADYIVTQAEKYKGFFDKSIPEEKFLPFGSPKFDKVIRLCQNPPEPPEGWKEKMAGRTVYFYNTSLNGMLDNTPVFLKKMEYVFDTFKGRTDACLLWRPHPLLESTIESLRAGLKPEFDRIKRRFFDENLGIYDATPSIEETIALSDVYIGDAGTSVTSLFGVAGKPLFIFDNYIDSLPTEQDMKDQIQPWPQLDLYENEKYQITPNNKLWVSENNDHRYRYYMDLDSAHGGGGYYSRAIEIAGRIYVLPQNAQDMLIIQDKQIVRKIEFKNKISQAGAFSGYYYTENYIFMLPFRYPSLIRYNLHTGEVDYVDGIGEFRAAYVDGEWQVGGVTFYENELIIASPTSKRFIFIDMDTLGVRKVTLSTTDGCGTQGITPYGSELWLLPLNGMTLTCWDLKTNTLREYNNYPESFCCKHFPQEYICNERPFGMVAISKKNGKERIVLAPTWGNMFVELDRESGRMTEWKPKRELLYRGRDGYHVAGGIGGFAYHYPPRMDGIYRFWYAPERKLLEMDINTGVCQELVMDYCLEDVKAMIPGFTEESEWLQYGCLENAYNSLKDLLDGNITGNKFDRERALLAYQQINAGIDGDCGDKVYAFMKGEVL